MENVVDLAGALSTIDEKLALVWFSESDIPTYELVVDQHEIWTWRPHTGFVRGESLPATCRLTIDGESLLELARNTKTCDDLIEAGKLKVSGYYGDWQGFLSAFLDEKGRQSVTVDRARAAGTRGKALAMERAEKVLSEITTDDAALSRVRRMLALWRDHRIDRHIPNQTQLIPFPEIPMSAWGADEVARDIETLLQENFAALQAECRQFVTGEVNAPVYGHSADKDSAPVFYNAPEGWKNYWLLNRYRRKPDATFAKLPVTAKIVDELERRHTLVHIAYLMMEPGCRLRPHTDGASLFFHSYTGILGLDGCYFETDGVRKQLEEGKSLVFSDSFVHGAGNMGKNVRVVLAVLYPHPQLTEIERICVRRLQDVLPLGTLIFSGEYD